MHVDQSSYPKTAVPKEQVRRQSLDRSCLTYWFTLVGPLGQLPTLGGVGGARVAALRVNK